MLDILEASPELLAVAPRISAARHAVGVGEWGKYYVIYTDGSCRATQGVEMGPGGWAMILFNAHGDKVEAHGQLENTTSNRAEVAGLLAALLTVPEGSHVSIQSDSRYVVDHVRRWMRAGDNEDLWAEVRELVLGKQLDLQTTWVAGHNGHQHNERADILAGNPSARRHRRRR